MDCSLRQLSNREYLRTRLQKRLNAGLPTGRHYHPVRGKRSGNQLGLESKFIGKNFVFDDRLGERITPDVIAKCHQCGKPADTHKNCANNGCHLLFIQCDDCAKQFEGCCSTDCQHFIHLPEEERKLLRKGIDKGRNVFHKSRARLRPKSS